MWNISGQTVAKERFEPFLPVEVLDDYDGPRIFTLKDTDGELNLAYWSDGDQGNSRYVVVPTKKKDSRFPAYRRNRCFRRTESTPLLSLRYSHERRCGQLLAG